MTGNHWTINIYEIEANGCPAITIYINGHVYC